jgi:outer membrane protein OmpA-like peptidoglycan-associated protein
MTSNSLFTKFLPVAVIAATASTLVGCSTVKSISPFSSSVPYSQDVQPTIPKPAISEIPAFKPKPKPEVSVSEAPAPAPEPASAPAATPSAPVPTPAPTPAPPPPAPTAAPPPPPSPPASQSSVAPAGAPKVAEVETPAAPPPEKAAAPAKTTESSDDTEVAGESGKHQSSIPDADRQFKDDGTYPNLAQVPARPVNMPTFLDAKVIEKALVADSEKAKNASPASPDTPAVDSTPVPVSQLVKPAPAPTTPVVTAAVDRPEDRSPCLSGAPADSELAATIHFEPGSAAMTSATLALLTEALPAIRAAKGAIRIFGHGDTDTNSATGAGRFDLAAARAGAVAQAVAGYGIPVPRIAVGVACNDAAFAGASVQLYAES